MQVVEIDRGRLVAAGIEGDLGAVGQRAGVAAAGLGQRREVARRAGVRCRRRRDCRRTRGSRRCRPGSGSRRPLAEVICSRPWSVQPSPKALVDWLSTVAVPV